MAEKDDDKMHEIDKMRAFARARWRKLTSEKAQWKEKENLS